MISQWDHLKEGSQHQFYVEGIKFILELYTIFYRASSLLHMYRAPDKIGVLQINGDNFYHFLIK